LRVPFTSDLNVSGRKRDYRKWGVWYGSTCDRQRTDPALAGLPGLGMPAWWTTLQDKEWTGTGGEEGWASKKAIGSKKGSFCIGTTLTDAKFVPEKGRLERPSGGRRSLASPSLRNKRNHLSISTTLSAPAVTKFLLLSSECVQLDLGGKFGLGGRARPQVMGPTFGRASLRPVAPKERHKEGRGEVRNGSQVGLVSGPYFFASVTTGVSERGKEKSFRGAVQCEEGSGLRVSCACSRAEKSVGKGPNQRRSGGRSCNSTLQSLLFFRHHQNGVFLPSCHLRDFSVGVKQDCL